MSGRVTGEETVARAFATIEAGAQDVGPYGAQIAAAAKASASALAPRRTGWMAQTISGRGEPYGALLQVGAVYGGVIEWGWPVKRIRGRHYMARGIMAATDAVVEAYGRAMIGTCEQAQRGD